VDEKRDRKRLAHLLTERSPEGELVLQRRSDGACVHLGERGCTVYEQRPAVCRTFDCRVFAAMGLVERCGPSHQTVCVGLCAGWGSKLGFFAGDCREGC
jgi:Fe-S-cluster containining protein